MKKSILLICITAILLLLLGSTFACTSDTRKLGFTSDTYDVYLSGGSPSVTPEVYIRPRGNEYILSVSNPTIAKVEGTTVTGLKEGIVTLTVTSGELTDTATLIVHLVYTGETPNGGNTADGKHTVFFQTDYSAVPAQRVADGEKATEPTAPNRNGYKLYGWYTDPDFNTPYDFSSPVTGNITLYALWGVDVPVYKFTTIDGLSYVSGFKYGYIPYETASLPATDDNGNIVYGIFTGAFSGNKTLVSVTIPDTYTRIYAQAFENCEKLESVTFSGAGLTTLDELVFGGCENLESVEFGGEGLETIGASCFRGCLKLTTLNIPDSVSKIGSGAFLNCKSFNISKLPASLKVIEMQTFANTAITSIDLSGIEAIYNQAFWGTTSLSTVTNPDSLILLGSYVFGSLLSSEESNATAWLKNTHEISRWGDKNGASVTYLGNILVYVSPVGIGTKPLPVYVKQTITSIAGQAFSDVNGAMAYFIGGTPPTYGTNAFGGTTEPTTDIVVPYGKTETYAEKWLITSTDEDGYYVPSAYSLSLIQRIYEYTVYPTVVTGMIMYSRYPLKNFSTVSGETIYYSKLKAHSAGNPYAGIEFGADEKYYVIHAYTGTDTALDLNEMLTLDASSDGNRTATIEKISAYAFGTNSTLVTLKLPDRIKNIEDYAFIECSALKSLYLVGDGTYAPSSYAINQNSFNGSMMPSNMKVYVPSAQLERYNVRWGTRCPSLKGRFEAAL